MGDFYCAPEELMSDEEAERQVEEQEREDEECISE
jgi:hypothetical protein